MTRTLLSLASLPPLLPLLALGACDVSASDASGQGSDAAPAPLDGSVPADGGAGAPDTSSPTPPPDPSSGADAHVADAGTDAAAQACKALFCDDFESGKLDAQRWELDVGYDPANVVVVQTGEAAHGTHAAHAHIANAGGGFAFARAKSPFPALANGLWGRAYIFQTVDATVGHNALVKMESGAGQVLEIGQSQAKVQLTFYPPSGENPVGYATSIPLSKWTCMEWHMSTASPQIELFADGASLASYAYSGALTVPAFAAIKLGVETHSTNTSADDVYFDDVALDAARIGCLP